jgi:CheY-like chemotaxis protein
MNIIKKIFIAEDEPVLQEIYSQRFREGGFEVKSFNDGEQLLTGLSEETPDVLLLDIMMPNMNGIDSLEAIRSNFTTSDKKDVKVIVWSNSGSEDTVRKCLQAGAIAFLKKSEYAGNDLVEKVKNLLDK